MDRVPDDRTILRARARVGTLLQGKWRLEKLLCIGRMTSVYAATHRNGTRGAVKLLEASLADEPTRARFLRDGYLANRIDHPGTVVVLDDDVAEDGSVFLVMELLDGESVASILDACRDGRIDAAHVIDIADAVLDVLAAAHDAGFFHGDVAPANLFVTRGGRLKLLGFGHGASRAQRAQAPRPADAIDERADVWGVGATMFRLLTGHAVHVEGGASTAPMAAPPVRSIAREVSPDLACIVDRALVPPEQRWPSARAMQQALRGLSPSSPHRSVGASPLQGSAPDPRYLVPVEASNRGRPALARRLRWEVVVASVVIGGALTGSTWIVVAADRTPLEPAWRPGAESTSTSEGTTASAADDPDAAAPQGTAVPLGSWSAAPQPTSPRGSVLRRAPSAKPSASSMVAPNKDPLSVW